MISIILPTRNRPHNLKRLYESVKNTTQESVEFSIYADDDDSESADVAKSLGMVVTVGPRVGLSEMWNAAQRSASGDIFMLCGDDIIFRTPGWDEVVEAEFARVPDRILLVHGDDLSGNAHNGSTHGFIHRAWVEALGYFVPPFFSCDYVDAWWNHLADELGRRVFLPGVVTEHLHPSFGKAVVDEVYQYRRVCYSRDQLYEVWDRTEHLRRRDVELLSRVILENRF